MDQQYLDFVNENMSIDHTRKNVYLNANLSLKDVLSPGENLEEIEISVVAGSDTKIHALLLYLAIITEEEELDFQKVRYMKEIIMICSIISYYTSDSKFVLFMTFSG